MNKDSAVHSSPSLEEEYVDKIRNIRNSVQFARFEEKHQISWEQLKKYVDVEVTVICYAHNVENFIADAIESILGQQTDFRFILFLCVDYCDDNTDKVAVEYGKRYPDLVSVFCHSEYMGSAHCFAEMINKAYTPFIAYCEGEDFWIDEQKLQKQHDYMIQNKKYSFCFAGAEIFPEEGDENFSKTYKPDRDGHFVLPFCIPKYNLKKKLKMVDIINLHAQSPSTLFFRWNYDFDFPEWYFGGEPCGVAVQLMQLGGGEAGYLTDAVAVCRTNPLKRREKYIDKDGFFLQERLDNIRWLSGMWEYYLKRDIDGKPVGLLQSKLKKECFYFLNPSLNKYDDFDTVMRLFKEIPIAGEFILKYYIAADADRRNLESCWGWNGYTAVVRHKKTLKVIKPYSQIAAKLLAVKKSKVISFVKTKCKHFIEWLCYWRYSFVPKRDNLWVISGFPKTSYMDNTKYLFEYVSNKHPEIEIWWLTRNNDVFKQISKDNRNVCMFGTRQCRKVLSHARVAIVDHYACEDFERTSGFNNGIRVVNLWHGVGFKAAGDENGPKWSGKAGLIRSIDILTQSGDSTWRKFVKRLKYFRHAYMRELFEKYLMFVCPGQERIDMIGKIWGIPEECYFMAGHPRNEPVYNTMRDTEHPKIIYAPTYREYAENEAEVVDACLSAVPQIQNLMEKLDGTFTIRLHPHTWRDYKGKILKTIRNCDRILLDREKDVYPYIGTFSVMISDYSSIALDFAMIGRPVIFLCPDLDNTERGFNLDFKSAVPGPIVAEWSKALEKAEYYIHFPEADLEFRMEKCKYFFNPEVNGNDNSERITEEIKRRIEGGEAKKN